MPFALLGCLILIFLGVRHGMKVGYEAFVPYGPGIVYLILLPPAWGRKTWAEWSPLHWSLGVFAHLAGQFLMGRLNLETIHVPMQAGFAVYLFLFLMTLNRQGIRESTHGERKPPALMRRRNQVLVTLLFIPALAAACWGALGQLVENAWEAFKRWIGAAIEWLANIFRTKPVPLGEIPKEASPQSMLPMGGKGDGEGMSPALEIFLISVAALTVLVLLIVLGRILFKKLRSLIRRLMEMLRRYTDASNEDYVDEAESTLDIDERKRIFKDKLQRAFSHTRPVPWQQLDGRGRMRRLYQQFLMRRPEAVGLTAREAVKKEKSLTQEYSKAFYQLYEKARYSDHPIDAGEADAIRKEIK